MPKSNNKLDMGALYNNVKQVKGKLSYIQHLKNKLETKNGQTLSSFNACFTHNDKPLGAIQNNELKMINGINKIC